MDYNRCGKSGLLLPQISLGLWHNFGSVDSFENAEGIAKAAFDKGITHFDLANNYGPDPGSAEITFGKILKKNFHGNLRDEIVVSTKAGYTMWKGPYGDWGSRKYLLSSLNQSLKRMNLEYVDVFYSHRYDPETPLEETMMALDYAVRSGKAMYAGISNYNPEQTRDAVDILKQLGTPCLIHQVKYSMFERNPEIGLLNILEEKGVGCIAFSPLAQGLLTDKYIKGIPKNSRASNPNGHLKTEEVSEEKILKIIQLTLIAQKRNQSLAQMALAWLLKDNRITSVLIGASSIAQLNYNIDSLQNLTFSKDELDEIDTILQ
ncbi:L-glyceraldehyde 3-phosphate reductase [Flavobacterium sp. LS1P28]|uniref:aldo/keto reductase n=1 Tax=unclassified Flavobacterium TaxID=196869 RepID=UPI000F841518|nr:MULTISPECIES: aldo/keto reductase [unclassified Flavobacterium]RTY78566.1 L-glyceraldehyde 3-phosphate reductase [Flavobacterium sp. LS1P28]RTY87448.1 L-glyceraldehyde 3-phosphate reductase [Flavobacterium sp. RSP15]RTY89517.1 L-glyceraldehyde 3-phosphate reductase [Flavobacterium sp. GSN2]